jgi:hypothetical protein
VGPRGDGIDGLEEMPHSLFYVDRNLDARFLGFACEPLRVVEEYFLRAALDIEMGEK